MQAAPGRLKSYVPKAWHGFRGKASMKAGVSPDLWGHKVHYVPKPVGLPSDSPHVLHLVRLDSLDQPERHVPEEPFDIEVGTLWKVLVPHVFLPRPTLCLVLEDGLDVVVLGVMPEADLEGPGVGVAPGRVLISEVVDDLHLAIGVAEVHHVMERESLAGTALVQKGNHPARRLARVEPRLLRHAITELFPIL